MADFNQAPTSVTKIPISILSGDGSRLLVYGKVRYKECRIIDTGPCSTIVRPDMLPTCRVMVPKESYILETTNVETIPVLGIHETKFQIGQQAIPHKVFIADIFDDVIFGLDIMPKYEFKLDLPKEDYEDSR